MHTLFKKKLMHTSLKKINAYRQGDEKKGKN